MKRWRCKCDMTNEEFVEQYEQDINHIYDLFNNICTFKKIPFSTDDNWTQNNNGIFKLQIPSSEYFVLAAFEKVDGASDIRVNCETGIKYSTVVTTEPINGYLVVAVVDYDDEDYLDTESNKVIDTELNQGSINPVTNRAITKAIKALEKQVAETSIPDALPASDVYAWAKAINKPIYTWNEICAKPDVVTSIVYNGEKLPKLHGQVSLDGLDEIIKHPTKLSEFEKDINLFDLLGGEDLLKRLNSVDNTTEALNTKIINNKGEIDNAIFALNRKEVEDVADLTKKINDNYSSTSQTISRFNSDLTSKVDNLKTSAYAEINFLKEDLAKAISTLTSNVDRVRSDNGIALNQHSSDILSLQSQLNKVTTDIAGIDIGYVDRKIEFVQEAYISPLSTKVEEVKQNVKAISDKEAELETSVINLTNTYIGSNSQIEANKKAISSLESTVNQALDGIENSVDELAEKIDEANTNIEGLDDKINEANTNIAGIGDVLELNTQAIVSLSARVDNIPNDIKVVDIKESTQNGYINVNDEDIKVYEPINIPIPTKLSDLENDTDFITADDMNVNYEFTKYPTTSTKGMEYNEYVNITSNSGNVYLNGENINLNQTLMEKLTADVKALKEELTTVHNAYDALNSKHTNEMLVANAYIASLQEMVNKNNGIISVLQDTVNELWNYVGDPDRRFDERDVPLVDKQDKVNAVTDEDALTAKDIHDILNELE